MSRTATAPKDPPAKSEPSDAPAPTPADFAHVALAAVQPGPWNPRKHRDDARQQELNASVAQHGVLMPILVKPTANGHGYLVVAGERRYTAAVTAGLAAIPVVIRAGLSDAQCQEIACIENLNRHDLHPLDEAEAFARLRTVDKVYTPEALAAKFGKPVSYVKRRLSLLTLPPIVGEAFLEDVITAAHAEKLAKLKGDVQSMAFERGCFLDLHRHEIPKWLKAKNWAALREDVASPAGLQNWIYDHVRADLADPDLQARLPELADAPALAKAGTPIVEISREWYLQPAEKKALGGILSRQEYTEGKPSACKSMERVLVVHGGPTEFTHICRDSKCPTHHPTYDDVSDESTPAKNRKPSKWELAQKRQQAQQRQYSLLKGPAMRALVPALLKASLTPAIVRDMLKPHELKDISQRFGLTLSEKTCTAIVLASHVAHEAWNRTSFAKTSKLLGFDLTKFARQHEKAKAAAKAKSSRKTTATKPATSKKTKKGKRG